MERGAKSMEAKVKKKRLNLNLEHRTYFDVEP